MGGRSLSGAKVSAINSFVTRRTSFTRSVTANLWYKRSQCVWTVCGERWRLLAMANSVRSSKTPRTICSSRPDNLRLWAISPHARSENIAAPKGKGHRQLWLAGEFIGSTGQFWTSLMTDLLPVWRNSSDLWPPSEVEIHPSYPASENFDLRFLRRVTCHPVSSEFYAHYDYLVN